VDPRAGLDEIEKILDSTGTRTPNLRAVHPVAIPTELSRLFPRRQNCEFYPVPASNESKREENLEFKEISRHVR
jgi:hypothetical protein